MSWLTEQVKRYKKEIVLFILFFLISSTSFALGYLSAKEFSAPAIVIEKVQRN